MNSSCEEYGCRTEVTYYDPTVVIEKCTNCLEEYTIYLVS